MKEWNPNPDRKLVQAIYSGLYARMPEYREEDGEDSPSPAPETSVRARTHDHAAQLLPAPVTPAMRVDAIRGIVGLYNRGMMSAENLLSVVVDIATEKN